MYSIGQVAEKFGMPISTLRYYDKQGLSIPGDSEPPFRRHSTAVPF